MIILFVIILIEFQYRPRIDKTVKGDFLLWYGRKNRRYLRL
jgi:hypothetical protein